MLEYAKKPGPDGNATGNDDWLNGRTWELPVTTLQGLMNAIRPMTLERFLMLPASRVVPAALREEVDEYLRARQEQQDELLAALFELQRKACARAADE